MYVSAKVVTNEIGILDKDNWPVLRIVVISWLKLGRIYSKSLANSKGPKSFQVIEI